MPDKFTPVTTTTEIDILIEQSTEIPVILFNHDPYCPISRRAYHQMEAVPHAITLIDVSRYHTVTRHISVSTHIRHESPQVILLFQGRSVWSASHGAITREAVEQALLDNTVLD